MNVYPTGLGSSVALVHLAMVDDSKIEAKQKKPSKKRKEKENTSKARLKIVIDIVHRLKDSVRVERVVSIDNKE